MPTKINEITVRETGRNAGGSVVAPRYAGDSDRLEGKGAAVLLVHGYNNSRDAAAESFGTFVAGLEGAALRGSLPWPVFGVQWPGDEENKILSALSYPTKIRVAQRTAEALGAFLRGAFGPGGAPITLYIVSHSLGGRVVTELLARLAASQPQLNIVVNKVAMMAAAIPIAHVDRRGDLRAGIDATLGVCVLHSKGDVVLHYTFPLGQTVGFDGFFPTAVGRAGEPSSAWQRSRPMAHNQKLYNHSDYWPGSESAAEVGGFFGLAVANSTPIAGIADRQLPDPNTSESTAIPERTTPVSDSFT